MKYIQYEIQKTLNAALCLVHMKKDMQKEGNCIFGSVHEVSGFNLCYITYLRLGVDMKPVLVMLCIVKPL